MIFLVDLIESVLTGGAGGRLRLLSTTRLVERTSGLTSRSEDDGSERTETECRGSVSEMSDVSRWRSPGGEEVTRGSEDTEEDSEIPESVPQLASVQSTSGSFATIGTLLLGGGGRGGGRLSGNEVILLISHSSEK